MDTNLTAIAAGAIGKMMVMVLIGIGGYKIGLIGDTERARRRPRDSSCPWPWACLST